MKKTVLSLVLVLLILAEAASLPVAFAGGQDRVRQILMLNNAFLVLREDGRVVPVIPDPENNAGFPDYCMGPDAAEEIAGWTGITQLARCASYVAGLREDGRVVAAPLNENGSRFCGPVREWENVASLSSGYRYIAALCRDGSILAAGEDPSFYTEEYTFFDELDSWTDIVRLKIGVCPAGEYAAGLRSDGTLVYLGVYDMGWSGPADKIVDFDCSGWSLVAVREDGTVVCNGEDSAGFRSLTHGWKDMKQIVCGDTETIGLRRDGTIAILGGEDSPRHVLTTLTDIQRIENDMYNYFAAYRSDGSVFIQGYALGDEALEPTRAWRNVEQIYVSSYIFDGVVLGLKSDGTVLSTGLDYDSFYREAEKSYR